MAEQAYEPSDYPVGERQLHLAHGYVTKVLDLYAKGFTDDIIDTLHDLRDSLGDAIDAETADERLAAIDAARPHAKALRDDDDLNTTVSSGIKHRVERLLDVSEGLVDDSE